MPAVAQILHRVVHRRHVPQPYGDAVAVADDLWQIIAGLLELVVGVDLPTVVTLLDRAFGPIGIAASQRIADVLQTQAIFVDRIQM